jgi:hypothetical protein
MRFPFMTLMASLLMASSLVAADAPVIPHSTVQVDAPKVGQVGEIHFIYLDSEHLVAPALPAGLKVVDDEDTGTDVLSDGVTVQTHRVVIECDIAGSYDVHFDIADATGKIVYQQLRKINVTAPDPSDPLPSLPQPAAPVTP